MKSPLIPPHVSPRSIYGIDFSGAKDAGRKIWISRGSIEGKLLIIDECKRASELPGSGIERDLCLSALREFIAGETDSVFGFDFPFGLPRDMVREKSWEDFVITFPGHYLSPDELRNKCREAAREIADDCELKRITDVKSKTPFSPYNLRIYRQTYYGISKILCPLIQKQEACVLPMQLPNPGKPWIIEICPASTLKKKKLYKPYKGKEYRGQRENILEELAGSLSISQRSVRENIIDDNYGDALDSVIAACSTFYSMKNRFDLRINENYDIEGYVFA